VFNNRVDVRQFGVDGAAPDNSAGLLKMRDALIRRDRWTHWTLVFPQGQTFRYSNNRWLNGLVNFTVEFEGAELCCTDSRPASGDGWPFGPREQIFRVAGELYVSDAGLAIDTGDRINAANVNDATITLSDPTHAAHYNVGDRIFLHSYCVQYGGYSPNLLYYEWHKIVGKAGAVLTLETKVEFPHLAEYPDYLYFSARTINGVSLPAMHIGKPRILNLDGRPQVDGTQYWYPEYAHFKGGRTRLNPNTPSSYRTVFAAKHIVWQNMTVDREGAVTEILDVRESEIAEIRGGKLMDVEIDKLLGQTLVDSVLFKDTGTSSVIGGTTTRTLTVRNCKGTGIFAARALDGIIIEGNKFSSLAQADSPTIGPIMPGSPSGGGAKTAIINGNSLVKKPLQREVGTNVLKISRVAPGVNMSDGTFIDTYSETALPDWEPTILRPGKLIWLTDQPLVKGIVRDVVQDGASVKVRFASGNLPGSIMSGYVTGTPSYSWSGSDFLYLNGEHWNHRRRFEGADTGLLDWSTFVSLAGLAVNGTTLVGDGTGTVGNVGGSFPNVLDGGGRYRLTYDINTTSGTGIVLRDGQTASNYATLSGSATAATVEFTIGAAGHSMQFRPSGFAGTFTPIKLERI
jgi:hypothetical protein